MLEDSATLVALSDFSIPSCRPRVLSARLRDHHTAMVLGQRVQGDGMGRTLHEVIRSVVSIIGMATNAAAFRADFFVRWGENGMPATLYLNEIEHSFNAGCMVGWFGMPATDAAMRAWALGGDEVQRKHLESRLFAIHTDKDSIHTDKASLGEGASSAPVAGGPLDGATFSLNRLPAGAVPYRAWLAEWELRSMQGQRQASPAA